MTYFYFSMAMGQMWLIGSLLATPFPAKLGALITAAAWIGFAVYTFMEEKKREKEITDRLSAFVDGLQRRSQQHHPDNRHEGSRYNEVH